VARKDNDLARLKAALRLRSLRQTTQGRQDKPLQNQSQPWRAAHPGVVLELRKYLLLTNIPQFRRAATSRAQKGARANATPVNHAGKSRR